MNKTTALRNIIRNANVKQWDGPDYRLHVAEHAGQQWVTNSYWCAPADWFTGLVLPDVVEDGTYNAKTGEKVDDQTPNLAHIWPDDDLPVIEPVTMHGSPVMLARTPNNLRLYKAAEDETAFNAAYLAMFEEACTTVAGGEMQLRQATSLKPAAIYRSTSYTRAHGPTETAWILTGLLMPVRLS